MINRRRENGADTSRTSDSGAKSESITARKILELRKSRGLTQAEIISRLAELGSSMNASTLSKIENGHRSITDIDLFLFSKIFGVSVDNFFN